MNKSGRPWRRRWRSWLAAGGLATIGLFVLVQAFPYGRRHTNPPVQAEPLWNSPETRAVAVRACFDCHSNQTDWRWYTNVAPVSWLTEDDVDGGRARLNFSEWTRPQPWAGQAAQAARDGNMPPWYFLPLHPEAKLSAEEQQALIQGLAATLGEGPRPARR
jgi:hypothetical protein